VDEYVSRKLIKKEKWFRCERLKLKVKILAFSSAENLGFFQILMCRLATSYWLLSDSGERALPAGKLGGWE